MDTRNTHIECSEKQAFEALKAHDRAALEAFVGHFTPLLRGIAMSDYHMDIDEAKDIAQETLIKVLGKLEQIQDPTKFPAYVFQALRNNCLAKRKKEQIRRDIVDAIIDSFVQQASLKHSLDKQAILRAISSLKNGQQRKVMRFKIEGYSNKEIAEKLNLEEEDRVRKIVYQAKQHLAKNPTIKELR